MKATELAEIIRRRKTLKVLGAAGQTVAPAADSADDRLPLANDQVMDAIAASGFAPFHYDRNQDGIAEPWRVHVLWQPACRKLAGQFHELFTDIKPGNKLPAMLAGCGALVLVNWLPQFKNCEASNDSGVSDQTLAKDKQIQIDQEHLAATAAMTQNLLLMLTAAGMGTYWSSGGQFRLPAMFQQLGIPTSEELLAAVFVDYWPNESGVERLPGKLREKRSAAAQWTTVVEI